MERFWNKVDKSGGPDACWIWLACRATFGYGRINIGGEIHGAHRLSYEFAKGPIPQGLHVLHRCDNPSCVNPAHLFLGTHLDNVRDMAAKHRYRVPMLKGERCGQAKLTDQQAREIRAAVAAGGVQRQIAKQYGVSPSAVHLINKGSTYADV